MENSSTKWLSIATFVAVLVIAGLLLVGGNQSAVVGGTTNFDSLALSQDLTVGGDAVVSGGSLNVTTSNTATSTLTVGCIQMYATSTATAGRLKLSVASTTGATGSQFLPVWEYGSCPI